MEEIVDLIATDTSPSEISDKIKEVLFGKASEKIEGIRPEVAQIIFSDETNEFSDEVEDQNIEEE